MHDIRRRAWIFPALKLICSSGTLLVLFALVTGCGRSPAADSVQSAGPATPSPKELALIERTVKERLAEENRITEQQLVNARAAASQRMVGVQMFRDLEGQYRERQAALSGKADQTPPAITEERKLPLQSPPPAR